MNGLLRSYFITSDWLLGFIEGEGSYTVLEKSNFLRFNLSLKDFMVEIKNFFNNLAVERSVAI